MLLKALQNLYHSADQTKFPSRVLFTTFCAILCSEVTSWNIAGGLAHFSALPSCFSSIPKGAKGLENKQTNKSSLVFLGQNYGNQRKQKRMLKIRSYEQLEFH